MPLISDDTDEDIFAEDTTVLSTGALSGTLDAVGMVTKSNKRLRSFCPRAVLLVPSIRYFSDDSSDNESDDDETAKGTSRSGDLNQLTNANNSRAHTCIGAGRIIAEVQTIIDEEEEEEVEDDGLAAIEAKYLELAGIARNEVISPLDSDLTKDP